MSDITQATKIEVEALDSILAIQEYCTYFQERMKEESEHQHQRKIAERT